MRRLALVIGLTLALVSPASAATIDGPSSRVATLQAWTDASLLPTVPLSVSVVDADCLPDGTSCTSSAMPATIRLSPLDGRHVLMHELGHWFDYVAMTDADRDAFRQLAGEPRPWRSPPNSPHECFAEVYAVLSTRAHPRTRAWRPSCEKRALKNREAVRSLILAAATS